MASSAGITGDVLKARIAQPPIAEAWVDWPLDWRDVGGACTDETVRFCTLPELAMDGVYDFRMQAIPSPPRSRALLPMHPRAREADALEDGPPAARHPCRNTFLVSCASAFVGVFSQMPLARPHRHGRSSCRFLEPVLITATTRMCSTCRCSGSAGACVFDLGTLDALPYLCCSRRPCVRPMGQRLEFCR